MLYRAIIIGLAAPAFAQNCASTDAGTDACKCYMMSCAEVGTMGTPVSMTTSGGPVTGRLQDGIERYFGIFAGASSAGANRWKPPQPYTWTTAIDTVTEHMCPQAAYPVGGTENCITVDVLKPTGLTGLPAAMWVHGGGFTSQNPFFNNLVYGAHQRYAFGALPNGGKVVTVLAHYRLGALGWMAHPGFIDTTVSFGSFGNVVGTGNYGMMDTINAISWISTNAANLGVDSTKVNVFGESAGAAHVTMLIASPLTQGLVASFIAQSPFISYGDATFSMGARQEMALLWTLRTGCTTSAVVATGATATTEATCLRNAAITLLIPDVGFYDATLSGAAVTTFDAAYGSGAAGLFTYNSIHCWPVVDGFVLTLPPLQSYSSGNNAAASVIIGHNAYEYATFCFSPPFAGGSLIPANWVCETAPDLWNEAWLFGIYYLDKTATYSQIYTAVMAANTGTKMAQLKAGLYYNDFTDPVEYMSIQMGTDAWFANGNQMAIEALVMQSGRTDGTVYHYVFAHDSDPHFPKMGACHGCELTFVLGFYSQQMTFLSSQLPPSLGLSIEAPSAGTLAVGNAMTYYWSAMWYYGSPNIGGNGLPTWSPMLATDKQTMAFQGDFPLGAMMNPCVRWASCRTEPVKDWRMAQKDFWGSAPAAIPLAQPACTSAPAGFYSHAEYASIGYSCAFLPCCTYTSSGRRNLLFGMPSSSSTSCDPMC